MAYAEQAAIEVMLIKKADVEGLDSFFWIKWQWLL